MNRQTQKTNKFYSLFTVLLLTGIFALSSGVAVQADDVKSDNVIIAETKTDEAPTKLKVGLFSRAKLLKAFYSSEIWAKHMQKIFDEYTAAEKLDDRTKMVEMRARTRALEDFSKKQLKGGAPLTNIFEYIWTQFPLIAKEAGVDLIVEKPLYRSKNIEVVDITQLLCDKFPLAEKNKKSEKKKPAKKK
ncbi:MAG: hypothetical protein KAH48_02165 [Chlorobi bacterium]|nr:hypothetical protein [Chlorobiota bacterium]